MPSIIDGLFAGRAGISSHGAAISVLSDNIANSNTTSFKQSRADFADLLAGNLSGTIVPGSGSDLVSITPIFTQGSFEFTGRGLDTGIDGNGFFIAEDAEGTGQRLYTRAGNFRIDTEGYLLTQTGLRVLGFPGSGAGGLDYLNVNERSQTSISTGTARIGGNLDAGSDIDAEPVAPGTTFAELADAARFSTFVDVFDSLGASHTVTVYFFHTAENTWVASTYVNAGDVGGTAGDPSSIGRVTMTFDENGALETTSANTIDIAPAWDNGAATGDITITFDPISQYSSASTIDNISQNGTGTGNVVGFSVEADGNLFAQLDNGQNASIGIIALASFANPEALRRNGDSLYAETTESGVPVVGRPGTGTYGSLEAGALELSNADTAADFIKLISLQRGFQGSSRMIQAINQLLNDIVNIAG